METNPFFKRNFVILLKGSFLSNWAQIQSYYRLIQPDIILFAATLSTPMFVRFFISNLSFGRVQAPPKDRRTCHLTLPNKYCQMGGYLPHLHLSLYWSFFYLQIDFRHFSITSRTFVSVYGIFYPSRHLRCKIF